MKKVAAKHLIAGCDINTLLKSIAFIGQLFALHANDDAHRICAKYIRITEQITIIGISACLCLIINNAILIPILWLWLTGDRYPIFPYMWPSTDVNTIGGFVLAHGIQMIFLTFGFFAICFLDTLIVIIFANVPMVATLIVHEIQQFQMTLHNYRKQMRNVKVQFVKILCMHQRYER